MVKVHENIKLILQFLKAPFLVLHFSCYTLMIVSVIYLSMLMIPLSILSVIRHRDQWLQLQLASELESDLRDTVDWGKKWLVDFNAGKTQLVSFDWSNNTGSIDVKMDGSVLEGKSSFKILGLTFSSKLDLDSNISLLLKLPPRKLEH